MPVTKFLVRLPLLCFALAQVACGAPDITVDHHPVAPGSAAAAKVVFIAGPDSHGPLAHEHRAGSELLGAALQERRADVDIVNVYGGWPEDESILVGADAVVMYCDGGKGHLINQHLESFNRLLDDGVGVVALHYCVEVPKGSPSATAMLRATGGYFETGWSVNPHWEAEYIALPEHPITSGIEPFAQLDEWYFNMRFANEGVTPILSAIAPAETMARKNGPHSGNDAVRKLVANGTPQVTSWAAGAR